VASSTIRTWTAVAEAVEGEKFEYRSVLKADGRSCLQAIHSSAGCHSTGALQSPHKRILGSEAFRVQSERLPRQPGAEQCL
jgi:hypothetical protein